MAIFWPTSIGKEKREEGKKEGRKEGRERWQYFILAFFLSSFLRRCRNVGSVLTMFYKGGSGGGCGSGNVSHGTIAVVI